MGRIVFTGGGSDNFIIPANGIAQGVINNNVFISTTGGTTIFARANGWLNANGIAGIQSFAWQVVGPGGPDRQVKLRFNRFKLVGNCEVCGQLIIPSSDAVGQPGLYPATGLALNCGTPFGIVRAGSLYGQPAINFTATVQDAEGNNVNVEGQVSFEAISGGLYTIILDSPDEEEENLSGCCCDGSNPKNNQLALLTWKDKLLISLKKS